MLLIEWYAWWEAITPLQAEEYLALYTIHLVGGSGWAFDRDAVLEKWRELATGANVLIDKAFEPPAPDEQDLFAKMRHIARWLKSHMGAGVDA